MQYAKQPTGLYLGIQVFKECTFCNKKIVALCSHFANKSWYASVIYAVMQMGFRQEMWISMGKEMGLYERSVTIVFMSSIPYL